eukprot:1161468-Pelagomonas_calceolata.AAC.6
MHVSGHCDLPPRPRARALGPASPPVEILLLMHPCQLSPPPRLLCMQGEGCAGCYWELGAVAPQSSRWPPKGAGLSG